MSKDDRILCPSAMCEPGTQLLGIVGKDGRVSILEEPILLDQTFISMARQGRAPEKRFRFTTPCIEKGCQQWKSGRCGVGDEVISALAANASELVDLPTCGIRQRCRWYSQSGANACAVCPEVLTDTTLMNIQYG